MKAVNLLKLLNEQIEKKAYKNINFVIPDKIEAVKENVKLYCPLIVKSYGDRFIYKNLYLDHIEDSIVIKANNSKVIDPQDFLCNLRNIIKKLGNLDIYFQTENQYTLGYGEFKLKEFLNNDSLSILTSYVVF